MKKNFYQTPQLEIMSCKTSVLMEVSFNSNIIPGDGGQPGGSMS